METFSLYLDENVVQQFDDIVWYLDKQAGPDEELNRSKLLQQLMEDYIEENQDILEMVQEIREGNSRPAQAMAAD